MWRIRRSWMRSGVLITVHFWWSCENQRVVVPLSENMSDLTKYLKDLPTSLANINVRVKQLPFRVCAHLDAV